MYNLTETKINEMINLFAKSNKRIKTTNDIYRRLKWTLRHRLIINFLDAGGKIEAKDILPSM